VGRGGPIYRSLDGSPLAIFALAASLLVGCQSNSSSGHTGSSTPPVLSAEAVTAARLSESDVTRGNSLYVTKCARCHKFYHPAEYSDADWQTWMTKMSRKAKLDPDQQELLSRYLAAFRIKPAGP
jgi:mono/diheme cytochrome c family protein